MFIEVCGFSVLQQLVFGFRKKIQICFRIWIRYGFLFFLFGFRFIFDMSGNYAPPPISNSCETSACSACHNCIGSIWVLITGMWIFTGFHGFASGFRFGSNFVYAVCGLDRIFCTQQPAVFYDYWTGLNWQRIDVASLLLAGPQNFFNSYNLFCRRSLPFLVHANCDVLDV